MPIADIECSTEQATALLRAAVVGAVGSTEILLAELSRAEGWEVPLVVTLPPELHGRHSDIVDLAPHAAAAGAELLYVARTNDAATLSAVRAAQPDYVFVVGWSQIVNAEFLNIAARGSIGYHPAPLPRLRGRAAIPWTILLDEPISASSLFWIGEGTDDGDILAQRYFHVARDETARSLYDKHMDALGALLREVLPKLASGQQPRTPQDDRFATWATKRTPADGRIDWQESATSIHRLVRAVGSPYPGAFTTLGSRHLTVSGTRLVSGTERHHAMPGQIVAKIGDSLVVQTGDGLLEITDWTFEDGRSPAIHSILGRG
ncbi:methionyl-tRNA formyltransferase [Novosphingobium panipatense]|uniref:methionyl-tRNA formyltransferase n=1 Tax=Novosphingobium TaxID=165696 RepID=UPI001E46E759|nr:formyltransferase family protein [Novosphingobium sp. HII-3]